uniref:Hypotheticial protein n=1 Tax=Schistosoma japonicum TaxID=6182 RepID=C7TYL6_SCHJA|nr:hypotheticial protein [Schistosoma japonicum]
MGSNNEQRFDRTTSNSISVLDSLTQHIYFPF